MKLTVILVFLAVFQVSAEGFSQEKISVNFENVKLSKALKAIEKKSDYRFVYSNLVLNDKSRITISAQNTEVNVLLGRILRDLDLTYLVRPHNLVIIKGKEENVKDIIVTGRVVNAATGEPISGASVQIKGSTVGTSTNNEGSYTITVPDDGVLVITSVGFSKEEIPVNGRNMIDVALSSTTTDLEEVVVVGYGTVKKKDLTGSVTSIQSSDFNQGVTTSPDQLIQGKTPGVRIMNNSGQPGGSTTVTIRGNSSIRAGNNPLFVLDGVPLSGGSARPGGTSGFSTDSGNPLDYINPEDIASIDILKDASATAIYGSRGANGVVIINTKKGKTGDPSIDIIGTAGLSHLLRKPAVLDGDQFRAALKEYTPDDASIADFSGNVNAFDAITRTSFSQSHNAAITGGTDRGRYRLSLGYLNQDGIIKTSNLTKYMASLNSNFRFLKNERLRLDLDLFYTQANERIAPIDVGVGFEGNVISQALNWNPTRPLKDNNGDLTYVTPNIINPLTSLAAFKDRTRLNTFIANISPSYQFTDWLTWRMTYSVTRQTGLRHGTYNRMMIDPTNTSKGTAFVGNGNNTNQQLTHTLTFDKNIADDLHLNAVAGYEFLTYDVLNNFVSASGFDDRGLDFYNYLQYSTVSSRGISSNRDPKNQLQSLFLRASFNYQSRYLLTATIRRDGSTKFGTNHRYANFPSLGLAWNIANEQFFHSSVVDNLKLRLGYGQTGNSEFPSGASKDRYVFVSQGINRTNYGNPDLKWENSTTYNAGVDFTMLSNRLRGSIDVFHKSTKNTLFERTLVQPAPAGRIWVNLDGEVINKGLEIELTGDILRNKDWNWDLSVNATFLNNNVKGLPGFYETAQLRGQGFSGVTGQRMVSGHPLNSWYLAIWEGIDPSTGTSIYRSLDGHSGSDVDPSTNKFYVHSANPKQLLGISTNLSYKKVTLSMNFNGAFGHYIFNNTFATVLGLTNLSGRNISPRYFKPDLHEVVSNSAAPSTRYLEKGNYLKMTNTTISYRLGNINNIFKNTSVFVTGQNLFVLTNYKGFDPEVNTNGDVDGIPSLGIEYIPYPSARTFLLGVRFGL